MKINRKLLPIKAHYFFFMAASGPMLPYLTVYGKKLGISEIMMGTVLAATPLSFLLAKPAFGFLTDYFHSRRKLIFTALIISTSTFYLGLYFVPPINIERFHFEGKANTSRVDFCDSWRNDTELVTNCNVTCAAGSKCHIIEAKTDLCSLVVEMDCNLTDILSECHEKCVFGIRGGKHLFRSYEFYTFITLMVLSMIGFNVSNSISDAICFDVLGEGGENKYGNQRVWGTIGFGVTAFLGGVGMDVWTDSDANIKNYTPAFVLIIMFTCVDVFFCLNLKVPETNSSKNILKDLSKVLKNRRISVFLTFVILVGVLDGFLIYFLFWLVRLAYFNQSGEDHSGVEFPQTFLEDLAKFTDKIKYIKILEGLTVAAETLGGEVIFFPLSGKIIKKLGYGHTFTLCFFFYALRLGLISLIHHPWWILPIELFMQGPTYALCYTTIVSYASAISPHGTSATMQGIAAGMDDGFGYAVGSLVGGFLYKSIGGRTTFQVFSLIAFICCIGHMILYKFFLSRCYNRCYINRSDESKRQEEILQMVEKK